MKTYSRLTLAFLLLLLVVRSTVVAAHPKNGPHIQYHKNGQKKLEAYYKYGKLEGPRTLWHENGQKKLEAHYKNGKLDGTLTKWDKNGKKESEKNYKAGKRVATRRVDPKNADNQPSKNQKQIPESGEFNIRKHEFLREHGTLNSQEVKFLFTGECKQQPGVFNCGVLCAFGAIVPTLREELFRTSFKKVRDGCEVRLPLGKSDAETILVRPKDLQPQPLNNDSDQMWKPVDASRGWQILEAAYILKTSNRDPIGRMNLRDYCISTKQGRHPDEVLKTILPTDNTRKTQIFKGKNSPLANDPETARLAIKAFDSYDPQVDMYIGATLDNALEKFTVGGIDFCKNHGYIIRSIDAQNKRVLLVNPHDARKPLIVPYGTFLKAYRTLYCIKLDYKNAFK